MCITACRVSLTVSSSISSFPPPPPLPPHLPLSPLPPPSPPFAGKCRNYLHLLAAGASTRLGERSRRIGCSASETTLMSCALGSTAIDAVAPSSWSRWMRRTEFSAPELVPWTWAPPPVPGPKSSSNELTPCPQVGGATELCVVKLQAAIVALSHRLLLAKWPAFEEIVLFSSCSQRVLMSARVILCREHRICPSTHFDRFKTEQWSAIEKSDRKYEQYDSSNFTWICHSLLRACQPYFLANYQIVKLSEVITHCEVLVGTLEWHRVNRVRDKRGWLCWERKHSSNFYCYIVIFHILPNGQKIRLNFHIFF